MRKEISVAFLVLATVAILLMSAWSTQEGTTEFTPSVPSIHNTQHDTIRKEKYQYTQHESTTTEIEKNEEKSEKETTEEWIVNLTQEELEDFYKIVYAEDGIEDEDTQISLEEAKQIKKSYKVGDLVQEEITPKEFGRIAAGTAKQVVTQKLREAERDNAFAEMNEKLETLTTGIVRRVENGTVYMELAGTQIEGIMLPNDQIPNEKYTVNSRIKVVIKKLRDNMRGVQALVSRAVPNFVKLLFKTEIPEIASGLVEIKGCSREAGYRTKIAVYCADENVDPVGACVGNKGMRINQIVAELAGEKIDIIEYSDDATEYIARALSPATVVSVYVNEDTKTSRVVVPDDKLSLAIGKNGQNVRLAARLTGWKIDVKSQSVASQIELNEHLDIDTTDIDDLFTSVDLDDLEG